CWHSAATRRTERRRLEAFNHSRRRHGFLSSFLGSSGLPPGGPKPGGPTPGPPNPGPPNPCGGGINNSIPAAISFSSSLPFVSFWISLRSAFVLSRFLWQTFSLCNHGRFLRVFLTGSSSNGTKKTAAPQHIPTGAWLAVYPCRNGKVFGRAEKN